jgi:hypothetical protein
VRKSIAKALVGLAHRIEGITYFPSEANPNVGRFAKGFQTDWAEFGKQFHWRLSWAFSPESAMFLGPNNEIIPVNRSIRDAIESINRRQS